MQELERSINNFPPSQWPRIEEPEKSSRTKYLRMAKLHLNEEKKPKLRYNSFEEWTFREKVNKDQAAVPIGHGADIKVQATTPMEGRRNTEGAF